LAANITVKRSGSSPEITGPYADEVRDIASRLLECDIVTVKQCGCKHFKQLGNTYYDGKRAEYYSNFRDACLYYAWHTIMNTTFWGVHLGDLHVVHIHSTELTKPAKCRECKRREALLEEG
jgi:hypothetical protein